LNELITLARRDNRVWILTRAAHQPNLGVPAAVQKRDVLAVGCHRSASGAVAQHSWLSSENRHHEEAGAVARGCGSYG
jgi:hypothetical protein